MKNKSGKLWEIRKFEKIQTVIKMCLPALVALCCYLLAFRYTAMAYLTNDDGSIQSALSGCMTGEPYAVHQFINVLIGYPLTWFYKMFPSVQWWYVWSHFLLITGLLFTNYAIVLLAKKRNFSYKPAICFVVLIDFVYIAYSISNISFTIVPAILGTGIVASIFWVDEKQQKVFLPIGFILFLFLMGHRKQSGQVIFCYMLLSVFYRFICTEPWKFEEGWKKTVLKFGIIAAGMLIITIGVPNFNKTYQAKVNGQEFREYNSARSSYMDFPHDSFEVNPEIYESVGWDYDTYRLVNAWCFLDEDVTAENFKYLSENSEFKAEKSSMWNCMTNLLDNSLSKAAFVVWLLSVGICLFSSILGFEWKHFLTFLFNLLGTLVLILYQLFIGRILYRTLIIVLLPAVVINLLLLIENNSHIKNKKYMRYLMILFIVLASCGMVQTAKGTFSAETKMQTEIMMEKDRVIKEYAIEHKENIYVKESGVSNNIDPKNIYAEVKPNHIFSWGGSEMYSKLYFEKIQSSGLSSLTGESFKEENVFFISKADAMVSMEDELFESFYKWLKREHGAIGFVKTDTICDGAYVYRFVFESNESKFGSYYDLTNDNELIKKE